MAEAQNNNFIIYEFKYAVNLKWMNSFTNDYHYMQFREFFKSHQLVNQVIYIEKVDFDAKVDISGNIQPIPETQTLQKVPNVLDSNLPSGNG